MIGGVANPDGKKARTAHQHPARLDAFLELHQHPLEGVGRAGVAAVGGELGQERALGRRAEAHPGGVGVGGAGPGGQFAAKDWGLRHLEPLGVAVAQLVAQGGLAGVAHHQAHLYFLPRHHPALVQRARELGHRAQHPHLGLGFAEGLIAFAEQAGGVDHHRRGLGGYAGLHLEHAFGSGRKLEHLVEGGALQSLGQAVLEAHPARLVAGVLHPQAVHHRTAHRGRG